MPSGYSSKFKEFLKEIENSLSRQLNRRERLFAQRCHNNNISADKVITELVKNPR